MDVFMAWSPGSIVRCTRQNSFGVAQVCNRFNWRNKVDTTFILSHFYFHFNSKMPVIIPWFYLNLDTVNKELGSYIQSYSLYLVTIFLFGLIKENFWLGSKWVTYLQSQQLWSCHEFLDFINILDCKYHYATSEALQIIMWKVGSLVE